MTAGDFKLPWNITLNTKQSWAERPETINEVGSTYTIQGFDLNYVGVILGPSVSYDEENNKLVIDSTKWKDIGAFAGANEYKDAKQKKEQLILNSINVLIKRGIHGLYIYACDEKLREKLLNLSTSKTTV